MEEYLKNKNFKCLMWVFIIISIVHVIYAAVTMRGMYEDGAFYMLDQLNSYSNGIFKISNDFSHPRFCIMLLLDLPSMFAFWVLHIHNKFALMMIFSCSLFLLPLLALWWNYVLTKKTKRLDIFYWSLFSYSLIIITFSIFSVVECILGSMLHFVLWNYLAMGGGKYNKRDIALITFLIIVMFGTFEYVIILGLIFFIASLLYAKQEENIKNKAVKLYIGIGALGASIFNLIFALNVPGEKEEITRFFIEGYNYLPHLLELNSSISIITLIILLGLIFNKKSIALKSIIIFSLIYILNFIRLINTSLSSVSPMWEQHIRTVPCFSIPLIFIVIFLFDILKKEQNYIKLTNYICIVLMCGIMQTAWQLVDTYYWDKNIQYMKSELNKTQDLLYIPSDHEEISSFFNPALRRYIWHGVFTSTSILFSESYEQKTLLLNYDEPIDGGNGSYREFLYIPKNNPDMIAIPWGWFNIKNKFWDLTKCADALKKYDIEHNIESKFNE